MPVVDLLHNGIEETADTRSLRQLSLHYGSCWLSSRKLLLRLLLDKLLLSLGEKLLLSWSKLLLLGRKLLLWLKGLLLELLLRLKLLLRKVLEA